VPGRSIGCDECGVRWVQADPGVGGIEAKEMEEGGECLFPDGVLWGMGPLGQSEDQCLSPSSKPRSATRSVEGHLLRKFWPQARKMEPMSKPVARDL
jgi:hypothetical protein